MRKYAMLFSILFLLLISPFLGGCCDGGLGIQNPFYSTAARPEVVPTSWGVVQHVAPSVVAVPAPTGVTYGGVGCVPGTTVPVGTTYTPGYGFQAPPAK